MRIVVVVGTRPEAIKLAPVITLLGREAFVVHTGQRYSTSMSGHLTPDLLLDTPDERDITRGRQLGHLVAALDEVSAQHHPDAGLVQGDTTSALAGALAANTAGISLVHPRTRGQITAFGLASLASRLRQTEPLDYPVLLSLIRHAVGLISDSGGLQEEATILKRPIIVIRRSNERPEVEHTFGHRALPGNQEISQIVTTWLRDTAAVHARLAGVPTPYGDGTASSRLVQALRSRHHERGGPLRPDQSPAGFLRRWSSV